MESSILEDELNGDNAKRELSQGILLIIFKRHNILQRYPKPTNIPNRDRIYLSDS
jgi:hypothetical protein